MRIIRNVEPTIVKHKKFYDVHIFYDCANKKLQVVGYVQGKDPIVLINKDILNFEHLKILLNDYFYYDYEEIH